MIIGNRQPRLSQAAIDDLKGAAVWARGEAAERAVDSADWMRAMSAAQMFEAQADELQVELDATKLNPTFESL